MDDKAYVFFLHGSSTEKTPFEIGFFRSDALAERRALELLAERPHYHTVEITSGGTSFEIKRST